MIRIVIALGLCLGIPRGAATAADAPKVREPAVAGLFYPKDRAALGWTIDTLLAAVPPEKVEGLKALVCPHAGYAYSGPVAASAYRLLPGGEFTTVVVMGPSHYAYLRGASVTDAEWFRTPLGDVPISPKARELARLAPFALEPACEVERPAWSGQSSRAAPATDTADTWEHSVEVEVPFLQRTLRNFQLVPVVVGEVSPSEAARALGQIIDDRTLIVASSDLSHYHPYDRARELDHRCVDAICRLDTAAMADQEACGKMPILILMEVARSRGWQARLLDFRNSGDTSGDRSRVVGYAAIAFFAPPATALAPAERKDLLGLARRAVRSAAAHLPPPEASPDKLGPNTAATRACFVTLTKRGNLRGCIGNLLARGPLYQAVLDNARDAALRDPRFFPVSADEVDGLAIEISVLTEPKPLSFSTPEDLMEKLRPGEDGVVLEIGSRGATYLPQVWEQIPDKKAFLESLSEKAGCDPSDWRLPGVKVLTYRVEAFKESDF